MSRTEAATIFGGNNDRNNYPIDQAGREVVFRIVPKHSGALARFWMPINIEGATINGTRIGTRTGYGSGDGGTFRVRVCPVNADGSPNTGMVLASETGAVADRWTATKNLLGVGGTSLQTMYLQPRTSGGAMISVTAGTPIAVVVDNVGSSTGFFSANPISSLGSDMGPHRTGVFDGSAGAGRLGLDDREAFGARNNTSQAFLYGSFANFARAEDTSTEGCRLPAPYGYQIDSTTAQVHGPFPYQSGNPLRNAIVTLPPAPKATVLKQVGTGRYNGASGTTVPTVKNKTTGQTRSPAAAHGLNLVESSITDLVVNQGDVIELGGGAGVVSSGDPESWGRALFGDPNPDYPFRVQGTNLDGGFEDRGGIAGVWVHPWIWSDLEAATTPPPDTPPDTPPAVDEWVTIATVDVDPGVAGTLDDTGVQAGHKYVYRVRAIDTDGLASPWSDQSPTVGPLVAADTTAPAAPGTPTVALDDATSDIIVTVPAYTGDADFQQFVIYRQRQDSTTWTELGRVTPASGQPGVFVDAFVGDTSTRRYAAAAADQAGNVSARSVATDYITPGTPGGPVTPPDEPPPVFPPTLPDSTVAADKLYSYLLPWHAPDAATPQDDPLYDLCLGLTYPANDIDVVARGDNQHMPWERGFDLDTAPLWILPWLAAFAGVDWHGQPTEKLRDLLKTRPRERRSSEDSMVAAVKATLVPVVEGQEPYVYFRPRILGPRRHVIVVKAEECPDPAASRRAALSQLPVFHQLVFRVGAGYTYAELAADYASFSAVKAAFAGYQALAANVTD